MQRLFKKCHCSNHCIIQWKEKTYYVFDLGKDCSDFAVHHIIEYIFHNWLHLKKFTKNPKTTGFSHLAQFLYLVVSVVYYFT